MGGGNVFGERYEKCVGGGIGLWCGFVRVRGGKVFVGVRASAALEVGEEGGHGLGVGQVWGLGGSWSRVCQGPRRVEGLSGV